MPNNSPSFKLDWRDYKSIIQYVIIVSVAVFVANLDGFKDFLIGLSIEPSIVAGIVTILGIIAKKFLQDNQPKDDSISG